MRHVYESPDAVPTTRWIEHPFKSSCFVPVHRRPMRLAGVNYADPGCRCFVTWRLAECDVAFGGEIGITAWDALREACDHMGFVLYAACLMPDHGHALVSPGPSGGTVGEIVKSIKLRQTHRVRSASGRWLRWQKDFYDHVLGRAGAGPNEHEAVVWYIRTNPVRAGLVTNWRDYPFVL